MILNDKPPRKKVDLTRLPLWLQYLTAILLAVLVFGLVYLQKGNQPMPDWIKVYVIEKPGVTALILLALFAFIWLVRRLTR